MESDFITCHIVKNKKNIVIVMDIYLKLEQDIAAVLKKLTEEHDFDLNLNEISIQVEAPKDSSHGDLSCNIAMMLSKKLKKNPREIAQLFKDECESLSDYQEVSIAGPGFLNFKLALSVLHRVVKDNLSEFPKLKLGQNRKINVEYVSANPTGPLHVGHVRGAVFGDALSNLLEKAGYFVTREYYVNDAGGQINVLAQSAYLRYLEALGEDIGEIPEGYYPGDYLISLGQSLANEFGETLKSMDEEKRIDILKGYSVLAMLDMIKLDLASLDIHHDIFFSEQTLAEGEFNKIAQMQGFLESEGHVYHGRLDPPKGKLPDDWEDREQLLFKAKKFGDDSDRALRKSNGDHTYFAADAAYAYDKFMRGYKDMIFVLGADHTGYVKRLNAVAKAVSGGQAEVDVKICQLVKLIKDGSPFKMSKRAGTMVYLSDIVEEVGTDAIRFMMLFRKNEAPLDFDMTKVLEQNRDNPVFYVQYAHARCASVFRNQLRDMPDLESNIDTLCAANLEILSHEVELALISSIAGYSKMLKSAAISHEPHRIAFYLFDLASNFHTLWSKGKEEPSLRFIHQDDEGATLARLALVKATQTILADGLKILGVHAPESMN